MSYSVTMAGGATLTIQPGVVVKFTQNNNNSLSPTQAGVINAIRTSAESHGETANLSFSPPDLFNSSHYYWRIDSVNAAGVTKGDVWHFTTVTAPPQKV